MRKVLFSFLLILLASNAQAQVNSCDKPQLTGNIVTATPTFLFAACALVTDDVDGIAVELNGVVTFTTIAPGPANTTGKEPFNVSVTLPARGNHTIRTAPFTLTSGGTRQVGPFSVPFVLVYEKAVPTTATTNHLR